MRGFYRLWIAASLFWFVAFIGWYFWTARFYGGDVFQGADGRLWCWTGEGDWYGAVSEFSIGTYARLTAIVLSVPIAMLLVGHIIRWAVLGFARPQG